jgi:hypothetical protein
MKTVSEALQDRDFHTPFASLGPTHDRLGMRLDWIFLRGFNSLSAGVEPVEFSDHHLIWAEIKPACGSAAPP